MHFPQVLCQWTWADVQCESREKDFLKMDEETCVPRMCGGLKDKGRPLSSRLLLSSCFLLWTLS